MKNLVRVVYELRKSTSSITDNPILKRFDLEKLKSFEERSEQNISFKRKLAEISRLLEGLDYIYDKKYQEAFNIYNELILLEYLSDRIKVEMVRESNKIKTPDFKFSIDDGSFVYSDLKTLHYLDGNNTYIDIQEQSTNAKIKFDKKIEKDKLLNKKKAVYHSDAVTYSPFKKIMKNGWVTVKDLIEELIKKIGNNIKLDQINYKGVHGIALIDLTNLFIPNDLSHGLPVTKGPLYKELVSGILWNLAFAEIGDLTYNWVEFEGKPNIGDRINREGVLKSQEFKNLKAIAFVIGDDENRNILGFHRMDEYDYNLLDALYRICDFVNDEGNSKYYELK